jgi:hypothetical protein
MRKLWEDHVTWTPQRRSDCLVRSSANPQNWPLDKMKAAMKGHLETTVQEASDRLAGKWDADVQNYDRVKEHILMLADTLTDGIVAQHANQFKK